MSPRRQTESSRSSGKNEHAIVIPEAAPPDRSTQGSKGSHARFQSFGFAAFFSWMASMAHKSQPYSLDLLPLDARSRTCFRHMHD
jgi:hypothetical protein